MTGWRSDIVGSAGGAWGDWDGFTLLDGVGEGAIVVEHGVVAGQDFVDEQAGDVGLDGPSVRGEEGGHGGVGRINERVVLIVTGVVFAGDGHVCGPLARLLRATVGRLVKGGLLVTGISALHGPLSSFHL